MKITVIIPTYRNPDKISTCLESIALQSHKPNEIIVLYSAYDKTTEKILSEDKNMVKLNIVPIPLRTMAKMTEVLNAGIGKAGGDVVCFLDEDVVPEAGWLSKIEKYFDNPGIVACGGKDVITYRGERIRNKETDKVGVLKWRGYIVGNQHRGAKKKDVMFLKGCNMAVRKEYLNELDENLIGLVRWEQDIFFRLIKTGMKVIYDPEIVVLHHKDNLHYLPPQWTYWYGHNTVYLFMKYLSGMNRIFSLLFYWFIGDASSPGLTRFSPWVLNGGDLALCAFSAAQIGKIKGFLTYLKGLT